MKRKPNQLAGGVFLSYTSQFLKLLIGLFYTPVMIRLLGQSEYGLYNIAASVVAYLGVLDFGFGSAYMRFYSRYKASEDKDKVANLNGMFLTIFSVLGVIAIIAGLIVAFNVEMIFGPSLSAPELDTAQILMFILVINLGVSFPNVVFDTYIQANENFIAHNLLSIIKQLTSPLVNLPLLLAGYGSVGMVIGTTVVNIVVEILTAIYSFKVLKMKISFKHFDLSLFREIASFSFYIFINIIVDQVNKNVDKTILGRYRGTVSVAVYSVGVNINTYYTTISTSISSVFTPRVHRMEAAGESNEDFTDLFIKVGRVQFILLSLVSTGFIFFGSQFINMWVGEGYENSYYVAMILMISITIPLIQNIGIEIQRAKNQHQFRSWLYIFMAIGNVLISIPLAIRYGSVGAAIGTALSYIIGNGVVMNIYNHSKVGLNMVRFWKEILSFLPALTLPVIFGIIARIFIDLSVIWNFLICGVLYIALFIASMWLFGLNSYEKSLVKSSGGKNKENN